MKGIARTGVVLANAVLAVARRGAINRSRGPRPASFYSNVGKLDVNGYDITDVKILCSQSKNGLKAVITAPTAHRLASTRPPDGSRKADTIVTGSQGSQTLTGAAVSSWAGVAVER